MIHYRMTLEKFDERGMLEKSVVKSVDDDEPHDEALECGALIGEVVEAFTAGATQAMLTLAHAVADSELGGSGFDNAFRQAARKCRAAYDALREKSS